jgi:hypothetical protein
MKRNAATIAAEPIAAEPTSPLADLMNETPLLASRLAREKDVDAATVNRWMMTGVKGRTVNGVRPTIRLESYRIGGRIYTTREAFARFVSRLNGEDTTVATTPSPSTRSASQRARDSARASKLAEAMGA